MRDPTNIRWVTIEKPLLLAQNFPMFYNHSTNISRIANLKAGSERAVRTGRSTYWSRHDRITTPILNWSPSCRNRKVGTAGRFQPCLKITGLCPVQVTTRQHLPCRVIGRFWKWTGASGLVRTRTTAGNPELLLTLSCTATRTGSDRSRWSVLSRHFDEHCSSALDIRWQCWWQIGSYWSFKVNCCFSLTFLQWCPSSYSIPCDFSPHDCQYSH